MEEYCTVKTLAIIDEAVIRKRLVECPIITIAGRLRCLSYIRLQALLGLLLYAE
jgi:hypothetical protein